MHRSSQIAALVKQAALDAGSDLAGIAPVRDFPELGHFPQWIADGCAGEMKYMEARDEAGRLKRASLRSAVPWTRSVIVCVINYNTAQPYSTDVSESDRGWISRYAWGDADYHDAVMSKLRVVERQLTDATKGHTQLSEANDEGPAPQTRCYVDTGPVVERVYAKYAGVGWIGKNTCIINQKAGSWLFLGVILSSMELPSDLTAPDRLRILHTLHRCVPHGCAHRALRA
jgi:epoxyqueuosine reductase